MYHNRDAHKHAEHCGDTNGTTGQVSAPPPGPSLAALLADNVSLSSDRVERRDVEGDLYHLLVFTNMENAMTKVVLLMHDLEHVVQVLHNVLGFECSLAQRHRDQRVLH